MKTRNEVIKLAQSWIGKNEADGSFKEIIDIYNSIPVSQLPRKTKMLYSWEWCACTWSALAIKLGYTDIMPIEISCSRLISKAKEEGIWVESDSYVPKPADAILYDWDDNGVGENKGDPEHIGIVEKVVGNTITVIEGNYNCAVKRRTIQVNGRYIRGYITPKYDAEPTTTTESSKPATIAATSTATKSVKATDYAQKKSSSLAGTYKVIAPSGLNVRHGAGTNKKIMVTIPINTTVKCYGYYTKVGNTNWLYVMFTYNGVTYQGFCSSDWLAKQK